VAQGRIGGQSLVKVKIYVEGGGRNKALRTKCRLGFNRFFYKAGLEGRMPRIVASGNRQQAFDDFRRALRGAEEHDFIVLLVDSEISVAASAGPWQHLMEFDKWTQPPGATDDQAHLMVQCMEAWFLADKECLAERFKQGFNLSALPARMDIEQIEKTDVLASLKKAGRDGLTGGYDKGRHSFDILARIDPNKVAMASPHAKRLLDTLRAKSGIATPNDM